VVAVVVTVMAVARKKVMARERVMTGRPVVSTAAVIVAIKEKVIAVTDLAIAMAGLGCTVALDLLRETKNPIDPVARAGLPEAAAPERALKQEMLTLRERQAAAEHRQPARAAQPAGRVLT
jgi:hypothetical protein